MGFHLRKSFKVGGLRFNLSNSGIGVSAGIKGLRVGIDGRGRSYISGGKGMVRFRESLDKPATKADKNILITESSEITQSEIPEELKSSGCFIILMILGGLGICLWGLGALAALFTDWQMLIVFIPLMGICAIPFITLRQTIRADITKKAVTSYNYKDYSGALNQFLKLKPLVKNKSWSVNNFVSEKIYKCYIELGQEKEALVFLLEYNDMHNRQEKIIFLYYVLEQYENLVKYFKEKEHIFDDIVEYEQVYNLVFNSYLKLKEYDKALEFVQNISYIDKKDDKIIVCYHYLKDYNNLISFIQKNISDEEKEEHPKYYAMLGNAFFELGQYDIALETLLTGPITKRSMNPEMCAFRYELGKCYEKMGDTKNALKQYQKIYAYDINYEDVAERIKIKEGRSMDKTEIKKIEKTQQLNDAFQKLTKELISKYNVNLSVLVEYDTLSISGKPEELESKISAIREDIIEYAKNELQEEYVIKLTEPAKIGDVFKPTIYEYSLERVVKEDELK